MSLIYTLQNIWHTYRNILTTMTFGFPIPLCVCTQSLFSSFYYYYQYMLGCAKRPSSGKIQLYIFFLKSCILPDDGRFARPEYVIIIIKAGKQAAVLNTSGQMKIKRPVLCHLVNHTDAIRRIRCFLSFTRARRNAVG
jgi:hypothetical protein